MLVKVKLFANFRKGRFKQKDLELPEGSTVSNLLEHLEIPQKDAKIIIVSGLATDTEHKLTSHDVVAIFPPIAGG